MGRVIKRDSFNSEITVRSERISDRVFITFQAFGRERTVNLSLPEWKTLVEGTLKEGE